MCERCREELAALASWTSAIERGYEARRAESPGDEPDWAAQRAAIVSRTSGRARAGEKRGVFRRWAPQIALAAVAALIVGIVWRENPREPLAPSRTTQTGHAELAPDGGAPSTSATGMRATADADEVVEGEDADGRVAQSRRADEPAAALDRALADGPAAPPAAREERFEQENAAALEKRAAEPSLAAPLGASLADVERFEREARAALATRDTAAARRALALWSDTLAVGGELADAEPAEPARGPTSLADSLRELLETAE
jgi:hypothetical protein